MWYCRADHSRTEVQETSWRLPVLQVYRHIVLAVHDPSSGLFGALGISRRANLMYKPLTFSSLAALLADYQEAYRQATIMQQ
jgi:hypothetical protein